MKKKFAFLLSLLIVAVLFISGCGTDPKTVDYNGKSYEELENDMSQYMLGVLIVDAQLKYGNMTADQISEEFRASAMETFSGYGVNEVTLDSAKSWEEASEICGTWQEDDLNYDTFKVTKAGSTLTTDIVLVCEKRQMNVELVYDYYKMEVSSMTIEPVYTLGEKMAKAGLNTLISISIVFCVLILICLIIYCFNIFPYIEKKRKAKADAKKQKEEISNVVSQIEQREELEIAETDDTELIAVIAAAIAASEGTSTSDFVVRSINRR